jgi:hypothetical protein
MTMKRIIMMISLVIVFASLFVFGVIFTGGQGSSGSIVSTVQAADDDDEDDRGSCRRNCSLRSLKGCYGSTITGTLLPNPGPFAGPVAGVVLTKYDGRGGFTQIDTVTIGGVLVATGRSSTGTYTVNPDCTGTATINFPDQPPLQLTFVLDDGGREIRAVVTNPGLATTSIGRKQ